MTFLLLFISAISKAFMDHIAIGGWSGWWNKSQSSKNKWKNGDPDQGERFFGSSTFLVWLTDGWHLFQMIFLNTLILGVMFYDYPIFNFWIDFIILAVLFKVWFELFYLMLKEFK